MSRSPLAYPLSRGIDGDAGGAADLQTDIMRFMAILALCLVAIFALVQSIPLAPVPAKPKTAAPAPASIAPPVAQPAPEAATPIEPDHPVTQQVVLTRPDPQTPRRAAAPAAPPDAVITPALPPSPAPEAPATPTQQPGFTLRFESDLALTRLVAANQVGFYAIANGRSQRMAVSESRISFWDASTPNRFHEMEASTVPDPVVQALQRTGIGDIAVNWGVTLPGKLSRELETVMRENTGGALVIGADGRLRLEAR